MELERFSFGLLENDSITTGFNDLDNISGGWQRGDLIMIAAPARMGKTVFTLSMLRNNMVLNKNSFIWFSTFLSSNQFRRMFFCNHTDKVIEDIINGKVKLEKTLVNEVNELFKNNDFYFYDKPNLTIKLINQILETFNSDTLPECLIIDNLNYLDFNKTEQFSNQKLTNKELIELKGLARKFNISIIVLFECVFPKLDGTDEFCVDSVRLGFDISLVDNLCYIYRPEFYKIIENEVGESTLGKAFFIISQSRYKTGSVLFEYNPKTFSFKQCS